MGTDNRDAYGFTLVAIGLLTGFFLGAGLVYLYTNREVTGMFAERTLDRIESIFVNEQEVGEDQEEASQPMTDLEDAWVSGQNPTLYDNDSVDEDHQFTEGIRISRDRLLGIKGFIIPTDDNIHQGSEGSRKLDSLIGGRQPDQEAKRLMYVEFWESPLNYSVYKLSRNRLVVYGIDQIDQVNLLSYEGYLFLKYNEQYYTLEHTTDFRLLQPENNIELIRQLDYSWP